VIRQLPAQARIVGTLLAPGGWLADAVLEVRDGRVAALDMDAPLAHRRAAWRRPGTLRLADDEILAPAFIDVHCHGAGGADVLDGPSDRMAAALLRHGVGAVVAAISTAPVTRLLPVIRRLASDLRRATDASRPSDPAVAAGSGAARADRPAAAILGLHLEGPALSPARSAGHDPTAFTTPSLLRAALAAEPATRQAVRVVTLAPELEGGLQLVRWLEAAGIVASVGHSDASLAVATGAYAAGARSTTHLFNGMPPLRARDPGPAGAALASAPFIELITDGLHVEGALLAPVARAIGEERLLIVSDALPLAASRRRRVATPGSSARLVDGRAVHPDGTLAGSRLLLDGMVAEAVRQGIPLPAALRAVTENPARLLGLADRGRLEPGARADLVVVARDGRLRRVLVSAG
jgi:N-acetylglucosamine-6-phosphate deacetylase